MDSQNNSAVSLCARGCGFYGTAENRNMCSKCYNDYLKHEVIAKTNSSLHKSIDTHQSLPIKIETCTDFKDHIDDSEMGLGSNRVLKNRCESCNKKVGFTGFTCRCEKVFCGLHRYPTEHSCTFDFKKADRELLVKQNPLLKDEKLNSRV